MSKTALKKELASFDREQLVEVILNAYSSSKEAKEYFEFFLNPDPEFLYEKKLDIVIKELNKSKRGYCKARVSVMRAAVKQLEDYGVGTEWVVKLMAEIIKGIVIIEKFCYITPALDNGVERLAREIIDKTNKAEMLSFGLETIDKIVNDSGKGRPAFRDKIRSAVAAYLRELRIG